MNRYSLRAAGAALLFALAGCGGGQNVAPPAAGSSTQSFDWGAQALQGATFVAPLTSGGLNVSVLVRPQDAPGLIQYAQEVSDPSSGLYRHYLTPQEIAARFGASTADYQNAARYFAHYGLNVAGWPQRLGLAVAGSVSQMEQAFGTKFAVYQKNGVQFVAPMEPPHFSSAIPVAEVQNLVSLNLRHRNIIVAPPRAGENQAAGYSPQELQAALDYNGAYSKTYTGAGITVGIIGTGPIEPNDLSSLASMYNVAHTATVTVATVSPSGVTAGLGVAGIPTATPAPAGTPAPNPNQLPDSGSFASPPPATAPCSGSLPSCNPEDGEAQLDTQQIATLAYGSNVLFYLAYNTNDCYPNVSFPNPCPSSGKYAGSPQIGIAEADAEVDQAIADDKADVISISYGIGETQQLGAQPGQYETLQFAALAIEGIAVFVSSGDSGSAECLSATGYQAMQCVSYPASDKNVTAVGGTTIPLNPYGQLTGPIIGWGTNTSLGSSASGGGTSVVFSAPSWQTTALGASMRETPDVSVDGDPNTGVTIFSQSAFPGSAGIGNEPGYGPEQIGGTSAAAPEMAAMWALVLDACKATPSCGNGPSSYPYRLGNAAPYFYSIYNHANLTANAAFTPQLPYASVFYDVLYGYNGMRNPGAGPPIAGFTGGTGYDEITGVGVPYAGHLIQAVTGQAVP